MPTQTLTPMTSAEYADARHALLADSILPADVEALTRAASARGELDVLTAIAKVQSPFTTAAAHDPRRFGPPSRNIEDSRAPLPELSGDRRREAARQALALDRYDRGRAQAYEHMEARARARQVALMEQEAGLA